MRARAGSNRANANWLPLDLCLRQRQQMTTASIIEIQDFPLLIDFRMNVCRVYA